MMSPFHTALEELRSLPQPTAAQTSMRRCIKALMRLGQYGQADSLHQVIELLYEEPDAFRRMTIRFEHDGWMYADVNWHFYCPHHRMNKVIETIGDINQRMTAGTFRLNRFRRTLSYRMTHCFDDNPLTKSQARSLMSEMIIETADWGDELASLIAGEDITFSPFDPDEDEGEPDIPLETDDEEEEIFDEYRTEPDDDPEEDDLPPPPASPFFRRPLHRPRHD